MIDLDVTIETTTDDAYPYESLTRLAPSAAVNLRSDVYVFSTLAAMAPTASITERIQPR